MESLVSTSRTLRPQLSKIVVYHQNQLFTGTNHSTTNPVIQRMTRPNLPLTMTITLSKLFKHELRSSRIGYQEHLQTGTTTTRKEKAVKVEKEKKEGMGNLMTTKIT